MVFVHCEALAVVERHMAATPQYDWLSSAEQRCLERLRDNRRRLWLAGRWLMKHHLVSSGAVDGLVNASDIEPCDLTIVSVDQEGRPNRPRAIWRERHLDMNMSLSHCEQAVCVAYVTDRTLRVGVDVADGVALSAGFQDFWFTPGEQARLAAGSASSDALKVWTGKEASYKACQNGEAFCPRSIEIFLQAGNVGFARFGTEATCSIRWQQFDSALVSIAIHPAAVVEPNYN